jgi:UDP-4-amino-4,6-dideoxy-N-acetyl-beta-L-altrosamine N-acetyltransferase
LNLARPLLLWHDVLEVRVMNVVLTSFPDLSEDKKRMVLSWRNHPEIRKWMVTRESIALSAHLAFIERLRSDTANEYYLVSDERGTELGVISFTEIIPKLSAMPGLYKNPHCEERGVGQRLMAAIDAHAIQTLQLTELRLQVLRSNERAIALYQRSGYQQCGEDGDFLLFLKRLS